MGDALRRGGRILLQKAYVHALLLIEGEIVQELCPAVVLPEDGDRDEERGLHRTEEQERQPKPDGGARSRRLERSLPREGRDRHERKDDQRTDEDQRRDAPLEDGVDQEQNGREDHDSQGSGESPAEVCSSTRHTRCQEAGRERSEIEEDRVREEEVHDVEKRDEERDVGARVDERPGERKSRSIHDRDGDMSPAGAHPQRLGEADREVHEARDGRALGREVERHEPVGPVDVSGSSERESDRLADKEERAQAAGRTLPADAADRQSPAKEYTAHRRVRAVDRDEVPDVEAPHLEEALKISAPFRKR